MAKQTTYVRAKKDKFGIPNCNRIVTAKWLNSLGPDSAQYTPTRTVGKVRQNWLRNGHTIEEFATFENDYQNT